MSTMGLSAKKIISLLHLSILISIGASSFSIALAQTNISLGNTKDVRTSPSNPVISDAPTKQTRHPTSNLRKFTIFKSQKNLINKFNARNTKAILDYSDRVIVILTADQFKKVPKNILGQTINNDHFNRVYLPGRVIDTTRPIPKVKNELRIRTQNNKNNIYLIQFSGPVKRSWLNELDKLFHVKLISSIKHNSYKIWANNEKYNALLKLSKSSNHIQWVGEYHPAYKLSSSLSSANTEQVKLTVQLIKTESTNASIKTIKSLAENIVMEPWSDDVYTYIRVTTKKDKVNTISHLPEVNYIEKYVPGTIGDERQDQVQADQLIYSSGVCDNGSGLCVPTGPGYLTWLASHGFLESQFNTFTVDISDTGIDRGDTSASNLHNDFKNSTVTTSRLQYALRVAGTVVTDNNPSISNDINGHGTHVSTIAAGYNNGSGGAFEDSSNFNFGLGTAPFARIGSSRIFNNSSIRDANLVELFNTVYQRDSRISNQSWGGGGSFSSRYDSDSRAFDLAVRDARPSTAIDGGQAGNQQLVIVSISGNDGWNGSSQVDYSLWDKAATAKNVLVVGGLENTDQTPESPLCISNNDTNNANDVYYRSSRGPVNVGNDADTTNDRFKPDLLAPATRIYGAASQDPGYSFPGCRPPHFPAGQTLYRRDDGTSYAAPAISGAAALLRQRFINDKTLNALKYANVITDQTNPAASPSPAMTKALLMNSTDYITGANGGGGNLPSSVQGMGRSNINRALDTMPRLIRDQLTTLTFTLPESMDPTQTYVMSGSISDDAQPFRATLVWADAPGDIDDGSIKNDLDLEISITNQTTMATTTYRGNNFTNDISNTGGSFDRNNNVESIWLPETEFAPGTTYTLSATVSANSLSGDGVPGNAELTDQDFALVIYNANIPAQNDALAITDDGSHPDINAMLTGNDVAAYTSTGDALTITAIDTTGIDPRITVGFSAGLVSYSVADSVAVTDIFPTSFTYDVTDGHGATGTATIDVVVTGINDPPTAVDDGSVGTPLSVTEAIAETTGLDVDVKANDSDVDGTVDPTTVNVTSGPTNGSTSVNATTGVITYTANLNYNGTDSFTYTIDDDMGATSNAATVFINVTPSNDPPVADTQITCTAPGIPLMFNISGTDPVEGDPVNVISIGGVTTSPVATTMGGSISHSGIPGASPFAVTYTPPAIAAPFTDTFTFEVDEVGDVAGTSSMATVTINVDSTCRQPVDLVLVLDTSGSMNGVVPGDPLMESKIDLLSKSVDEFLSAWLLNLSASGTDRIGLVYFNTTAQIFTPMLLDTNTSSSNSLIMDICGSLDTTMCTRNGSGATAMGSGLQEAYSLLTGGMSTNSTNSIKNIVLFTDGMQNQNPMVNDDMTPGTYVVADDPGRFPFPSAYSSIGVNTGTNPDFSEQGIKIHSIGLGTPGSTDFYTVLEKLSELTTGDINNARFTDAVGDLPSMWFNSLVDALSGGSLALVGHDRGVFSNRVASTGIKHSYPINKSAINATFILSWRGDDRQDALQFALRHKKSGLLLPSGTVGLTTVKKAFYTMKHIEFPLVLPDGKKLTADSEWEMLVNGKLAVKAVNYQTWSIVDDTGINYRFEIPKRHFNVGDTLKLTSLFTDKKGKPVLKKLNKASVTISSPSVGVGTFTATNSLKPRAVANNIATTSTRSAVANLDQRINLSGVNPDSFINNADKKLYLLLQNPDLRARFKPASKVHDLIIANNQTASLDVTDTKIPGIYNFSIVATGIAEDGSTVQRTRTFSKLVTLSSIKDGKTRIDVSRILRDKANLQITVTPIDKYGNYLGPGRADAIQLSAKGIEPVGKLLDNLDGSYTQLYKATNLYGDKAIVRILGAELSIDIPADPKFWWILALLLLLLLALVYYIIKRR